MGNEYTVECKGQGGVPSPDLVALVGPEETIGDLDITLEVIDDVSDGKEVFILYFTLLGSFQQLFNIIKIVDTGLVIANKIEYLFHDAFTDIFNFNFLDFFQAHP